MQPDRRYFEYQRFAVPDFLPMRVSYLRLGSQALTAGDVIGVYDDTPLPSLPAGLIPARDRWLADLKQRADRDGATFDNNLSYSLFRIDVERPQDLVSGERRTTYRLQFRPTDYHHFQFPNNALDKDIEIEGRSTTPRDFLKLYAGVLDMEELKSYPCHFKVGTGTVLISKPKDQQERIVISIRSRRQLMVGDGAVYHLSAAEGMLRPADQIDNRPSPFRTSLRSLKEELGLRPGRDFQEEDLRCLGIYFDTKRAQPFMPFFLHTKLSIPEIHARWCEADHRHENDRVIGLPWNVRTANVLCNGAIVKDEDEGLRYNVASNHAHLGFLLATAHENRLREAEGRDNFLFG